MEQANYDYRKIMIEMSSVNTEKENVERVVVFIENKSCRDSEKEKSEDYFLKKKYGKFTSICTSTTLIFIFFFFHFLRQ